jgi:hypothetical protein
MQHQNTNGPGAIRVKLSGEAVGDLILEISCERQFVGEYTWELLKANILSHVMVTRMMQLSLLMYCSASC